MAVNLLSLNQATVEISTDGFTALSYAAIWKDRKLEGEASYNFYWKNTGFDLADVKVDPSNTYVMSAYIKPDRQIKASITIKEINIEGEVIGIASGSLTTLSYSTWYRLSRSISFGVNGHYARITINLYTDYAGANAYTDGLQLEQGEAATTWTYPSEDRQVMEPLSISLLQPSILLRQLPSELNFMLLNSTLINTSINQIDS